VTGPATPFRLDGTELAGYQVHSLVGRGGMAYVYRAEDRRLGRLVALKVLAPELTSNENFRRRFLRESRLAASLDHPNIIPIYDAGEVDGLLFIVMRYVDGSDLKAILAGGKQLEVQRVVEIFPQIAAALDAAHSHGLVHRDVKPANVLISPPSAPHGHDHVYLSDFGITKRAATMSGVTEPGVVIGTIDYLAPEQIAGNPVTAQTDIYALGCVVYQALTGSVPFVRDDDAALLWAHLTEALPPISETRPDLPSTVQDVLAKAMAKDPDDRYESCGEFIADLTMELTGNARTHAHVVVDEIRPQQATAARSATAPTRNRPARNTPARNTPARNTPARNTPARNTPPGGATRRPRAPQRPAPEAAPARVPRRTKLILSIVAGVVALALAFFGYRTFLAGPSMTKFTADDLVPFSFSYPDSWQKSGAGLNAVFSPHSNALLPTFAGSQDWSKASRVAQDHPDTMVGLFTTFNFTNFGSARVDQQQQVLVERYPSAKLEFTDSAPGAKLGNSTATMLRGKLTSPSGDVRLRFECYIAQINETPPRTVNIMLFGSEEAFGRNRSTFDRIIDSVELPR
jgi:serine/threonine protein kinase